MSDTEKELGGQLPTAQIPGTTNDAQPSHRLETGLATAFPWEADSAPRQKPQVARAEDSDLSDAAASPTGRHDRPMSKRKSQPKVQEASAGETRHQETTLSRIANYPLDGTQAGVSASAPAGRHSRSSSVSSRNSHYDNRLEVIEHTVNSMAQLFNAHFARPNSSQTPGVSLIHPRVDHLSPVRNERLPASEPLMPQTQFVAPVVSHVQEGGSWQPGTNRTPNGGTGWLAKALGENCLRTPSDLQKSIAILAVTRTAKYWNRSLQDAEDELSRTKQKLDTATATRWPAELELLLPVLYQHEQSRYRLKTIKQRLERNGGLDELMRQMIEAEELSQTTGQLKILHLFFDLDSDWIPAEVAQVDVHPTARLAFLHAVHMMRDHLAGDDVQQKVEQFHFQKPTTQNSTRIAKAVASETDCIWATVGPDYTWLRRMNRKLGSS